MRQMAQAQSATLEQSCIQILSSPPTLGTLLTLSKSVSSTTTCESQQCLIIEPQFSCSVVSNSLGPHGLQQARPPCPSPTPRVYQTHESLMPSNHLILCCPLLLPPSIFPSIKVFPKESDLHIRWPKYWSFSISPSFEYSGLISFGIDWFDLLTVQGTLKSLLQYHSSKASIIWLSPSFRVQLSHPYMTIGKTIALTRWTFISKVMSLLFNMLFRFSSVQFSRSVMSNSLGPHELQHARTP